MRFLRREHDDMIATLHAHDIEPGSVLFVKRRGRLHVQLHGRADTFAFFRVQRSVLDEAGRWREHVDYFIGQDKRVPCSWNDVLAALNAWLSKV